MSSWTWNKEQTLHGIIPSESQSPRLPWTPSSSQQLPLNNGLLSLSIAFFWDCASIILDFFWIYRDSGVFIAIVMGMGVKFRTSGSSRACIKNPNLYSDWPNRSQDRLIPKRKMPSCAQVSYDKCSTISIGWVCIGRVTIWARKRRQ